MEITAYTPGDITLPGDKLGSSSGSPEGRKMEKNQEIMLFSQFLIQMCHKCTSRNDGLHKTDGFIALFVI